MNSVRRSAWACAMCFAITAMVTDVTGTAGEQKDDKNKDQDPRPKVSLRAQPVIAMSPARVVLTAELNGGANDFEEYYCPTVEWDWGDDTRSEATNDCEPYQSGKSEIKRRFTVEHVYKRAGNYRISFRMKRRDKTVGAATTNVQIRPGLHDIGPGAVAVRQSWRVGSRRGGRGATGESRRSAGRAPA
jgi:hypothetical protein